LEDVARRGLFPSESCWSSIDRCGLPSQSKMGIVPSGNQVFLGILMKCPTNLEATLNLPSGLAKAEAVIVTCEITTKRADMSKLTPALAR
jgi:hypothetical protein